MKEHTTHYACDCILNRLHDLENLLHEAVFGIPDGVWTAKARSLLKDMLKGVHGEQNVQTTRPPRKRDGVRLPDAVSTSHGTHRVGRSEKWK